IVPLSIHDGFITQARHKGRLQEAMERARAQTLDQIGPRNVVKISFARQTDVERPKLLKPAAYSPNVPCKDIRSVNGHREPDWRGFLSVRIRLGVRDADAGSLDSVLD